MTGGNPPHCFKCHRQSPATTVTGFDAEACWPLIFTSQSSEKVRFHLLGAVTAVRGGFLGYSIFMLCVSTRAGRRRDGGGCPRRVRRNGSWSHFSVPPSGAVAVLRQLVSRLLKFRSRDIDIKILRSLWNWTYDFAVVLLTRLSNFKTIGEYYQSPGFDISRNLRIRHLNSLLNRASTGRVVMLMKTKWELCSDMTIICLNFYEGRGFQNRKQDTWNIYYWWFCMLD